MLWRGLDGVVDSGNAIGGSAGSCFRVVLFLILDPPTYLPPWGLVLDYVSDRCGDQAHVAGVMQQGRKGLVTKGKWFSSVEWRIGGGAQDWAFVQISGQVLGQLEHHGFCFSTERWGGETGWLLRALPTLASCNSCLRLDILFICFFFYFGCTTWHVSSLTRDQIHTLGSESSEP